MKGTVFPPRFKHTSSLLKTGLHVFGGTGSGTLFNDVYLLEKLTEDLFASGGVHSPRLMAKSAPDLALVDAPAAAAAVAAAKAVANDVQVEALRQTLQAEKEAREKLEQKLAGKEGDFLVSLETTKRLEADLAKVLRRLSLWCVCCMCARMRCVRVVCRPKSKCSVYSWSNSYAQSRRNGLSLTAP